MQQKSRSRYILFSACEEWKTLKTHRSTSRFRNYYFSLFVIIDYWNHRHSFDRRELIFKMEDVDDGLSFEMFAASSEHGSVGSVTSVGSVLTTDRSINISIIE